MVVGGSQQKTLDLGFVLLGTRQQGVPGGLDLVSPSSIIKTYVSGVLEVLARDAGIPYGNEEYKERIRIFTNDLKLVTSELQKVCNMLF
ncbi:unnamed protein product [Schistosoma mattheei]|uniref:Uncharacterized protein n=1 Tax=Schistosoma mattheei TaxID=31246 RepID=A0A183NH81_9TREM|nr:unnamed protein product [Schistosoma mattheei]